MRPDRAAARLLIPLLVGIALAACGGSAPAATRAAHVTRSARWSSLRSVRGVVDLSARRTDGTVVVEAAGRLALLGARGPLRPFAPGYSAPAGLEPYLAVSTGHRVAGAGCSFPAGAVYALRLEHGNGVTVVDASGRHVARFVGLPAHGLENGIAFDDTGRFGFRLLVTATAAKHTAVFAIDCHGRVAVLTRSAPRVEGGIAVAPGSFGRFGGDLIAPDEVSGRLYAIAPNGHATLLAQSGIAHGQDIGVESEAFVPRRFTAALVADRGTPGNPHPGDDVILALRRADLAAAGVAPGDLLAVGEGGAGTVAVECRRSCRVRRVASGPTRAHVEGHVTFTGAP